jgi:hypothetical protein
LYQYEVILIVGGSLGSETFEVEADGHKIEPSSGDGVPPFIVFYHDLPLLVGPAHAPDPTGDHDCVCGWDVPLGVPRQRSLDEHIAARTEALVSMVQMDGQQVAFDDDPTPTATAVSATGHLEVFRAPLHCLLAVKLLLDDEDDE